MADESTYERLCEVIEQIERAPGPSTRTLVWAAAERSVALARDDRDRLEVFIVGDPLTAVTRAVADVIEHDVWRTEDDFEVPATRVVLPRGSHFDQLGALLCVELGKHGVGSNPQAAFAAVEPLVALALSRETVTDLVLTGLVGELALLEALLMTVAPGAIGEVVRSWAGSAPSARDFQLGTVGVEVKTTQGPRSEHHVEGVHQVEVGHPNGDVTETDLFLLSVGIAWTSDGTQGRSLPELVDSLLDRLESDAYRSDLLARIKQYGGDAALGYDHERDRGKPRYSGRFFFRFERLYDMADERIRILTSEGLDGLTNVATGSVKYRIILGDRVRGERNPILGWPELARKVLLTAGFPLADVAPGVSADRNMHS